MVGNPIFAMFRITGMAHSDAFAKDFPRAPSEELS
jgi:hypothetical protein